MNSNSCYGCEGNGAPQQIILDSRNQLRLYCVAAMQFEFDKVFLFGLLGVASYKVALRLPTTRLETRTEESFIVASRDLIMDQC